MKGKYLITTNDWFTAPDGVTYKSAWGNVEIVEDSILGIKTNRNSANWYVLVGSDSNHIIIAGCQIYYAVRCEEMPNTDYAKNWMADGASGFQEYKAPSRIYIAE